jgi:hypothetical protein
MLRPNEYFSLPQHASMNFSRLLVVELAGLLELLLQRKSVHQKVYLDPDPIEAEIMEHVRGEHKKVRSIQIPAHNDRPNPRPLLHSGKNWSRRNESRLSGSR